MSTLSLPPRIQRKRTKGWRKPDEAVYVGRGSYWGNYVQPVVDGDYAAAVRAFEVWLDCHPEMIERARRELRGRTLMCWCPLDRPCHADVLLRVANTPLPEQSALVGPLGNGRGFSPELLLAALRRDAASDASGGLAAAVKLLADWPEEYLAPDAVCSLIHVESTEDGLIAWVDWPRLAAAYMTDSFPVEPHIAAAWAFAAHLAVGMTIVVEAVLSDMTYPTMLVALDMAGVQRR